MFAIASILKNSLRQATSRVETERPEPDDITDAMNGVCAEVGDEKDAFVALAARRILEQVEW